jgi:membrane-associated protease RseP (regulator of RpoE activity)
MPEYTPSLSPAGEIYPPTQVYVARPRRRRIWIYVLCLGLTVVTTLTVGAHMEANFQAGLTAFAQPDESVSFFPIFWAVRHPSNLLLGLPFSMTLMLILFSHEMGHYLYCRYYGVDATLPCFVPFPSLIGTLGAFIRIRSPIHSRSALFDIGIAGPIAGFVVASVALVPGLLLSRPTQVGSAPGAIELSFPLIFWLANHLLYGASALPLAGIDLHPVAIAAWAGMFATAMNLLPGGQLDGGHIIFAIRPRSHALVSTLAIAALLPLGYYGWMGWIIWAILLRATAMRHPMVPMYPRVTRGRNWMGLVALAMFVLTFTPAPLRHSSAREIFPQLRDSLHETYQDVLRRR